MMMRSGLWQSATAEPSLRNSGLEAASIGILRPCSSSWPRICARTRSVVPTGTVDLVITTFRLVM